MYHAPGKLLLYCAYRIEVEHISASGDSKTISGTAFYAIKDGKQFLVTNRHNVDAAMKNIKYAGYQMANIRVSGYFGGEHLVGDFAGQEIFLGFPQNSIEDVAAIDVTSATYHVNKSKNMMTNYVGQSLIASDAELSKLDICDMVALPGYPDFYDRNGDRPIMRMGTIASDPASDYRDHEMEPGRRIAYEAFSSSGSSGSPVFALAKGFKGGVGITGGYVRELKLIGINAGHLNGRDGMQSHHSGISYCFKSTCILDAMNDAVAQQTKSLA
ncbi:hypothetical protein [Bradyrhizobium sp. G127]|uniref:hypothetical protein n=1 Tax=Bradyrhizobium sp. G127 TaxID=2904800 RepID=UPI001F1B640A|nr:hypothetical protein [Bradyrhizobium sp. G127]MCF2523447.1 hypothetical protein [Bradyrhizobium sp. G127]